MKTRTSIALAIIGVAVIILGCLFKYLHWNGGNIQILAGTLMLAVALVALAINIVRHGRRREQQMAAMEQQRMEQERLIGEMRIREQVGRDMHDDLGAGLNVLRMRSELAERRETDPVRREELAFLSRQAGELIGSMRQILWAMDTEGSDLPGTLDHCVRHARGYLADNGLRLVTGPRADLPGIGLSPGQRRNLFLLVKEALHNVVKHAGATEVRITARWSDGLELEIRDNGSGRGEAPEHGAGRGMANMAKRAEELGGHVRFIREQGMRVSMHVPFG